MCWRADKGVRPYRACGLRHPRKGRHAGRPPQNAQGRRYLRRGRCLYRPATPVPPRGSQRQRKEKQLNAMTTPTISAPSATGRQLQKSQKSIACPKARPNRSRHRFAAPLQRGGPLHRSASKRPFLLDRARPVFFSGKTEKKMGGASPLDKPPAGADTPRPPSGVPCVSAQPSWLSFADGN